MTARLAATNPLYLSSSAREILKWIALVLMTGDHVYKVLLPVEFHWLTDVSRVVFPIFAVVLAANLHDASPETVSRSLRRMLICAVIAQPFHMIAFGYMVPVNVLFTLAAGVAIARSPGWMGIGGWFVFGFFVDYAWSGLAVVAAAHLVFRRGPHWLIVLVAAIAALYDANVNLYALWALPIIAGVGYLFRGESFPRHRWAFLGYYVGHLAILAVVAHG